MKRPRGPSPVRPHSVPFAVHPRRSAPIRGSPRSSAAGAPTTDRRSGWARRWPPGAGTLARGRA